MEHGFIRYMPIKKCLQSHEYTPNQNRITSNKQYVFNAHNEIKTRI